MNCNVELFSLAWRHQFLGIVLVAGCLFTTSAGAATLFVSDGVDDAVHRFDATTGAAISPDIPLLGVTGVATGSNGDLYAASQIPSQVYRYDSMSGAQIGGPFVTFNGQNDGHDV
ncbi:MAG TPA: hypothetical protein VHU84_11285, partial [Lacipirellulaceae bacterium]|nr:hypothetical protein [Lacipirellulaceae bacterium]